jgi:hypothetical protein
MGRKSQCTHKTNGVTCRNLSTCHREYIIEKAAIATIERGYAVSQSAIIAEIVGNEMRSENFGCRL